VACSTWGDLLKKYATVLLAALLSAGLVTPARAAESTDPAPIEVKISWKDDTYQSIHVTWSEDGAQPNRVVVRRQGETAERAVWYVPADASNAIDLPKEAVRQTATVYEVLEIGVAVGTEAVETSPVAVSAPFDILYPAQTLMQGFAPSGASTLQIRWDGWERGDTATPDDPLDTDAPMVFHPMYQVGTAAPVPIGRPTTATSLTFTGPKPPFDVYVWSENEWSTGSPSDRVHARTTAFTTSIPKWVIAGSDTVVSGTYSGPRSARVTLQARNSPTSPWYAVVANDFTGGRYRFTLPSQGTRQYRVVIGNTLTSESSASLTAWYGGYSAPVTTTTQQRVSTSPPGVPARRGSTKKLYVYVKPSVNGTAVLQRWNGKTWALVRTVSVRSGFGTAYLNTRVTGRFVYRFYVPQHIFGANPVAGAYSPNYVLTVNP
jgi:hypothetical protein